MLRFLLPAAALLLTAAAQPTPLQPPSSPEDPYIWLEEIEGERALAQVREWNKETEDLLTAWPGYEQYRRRALAILNDEQQIAAPIHPDRDSAGRWPSRR